MIWLSYKTKHFFQLGSDDRAFAYVEPETEQFYYKDDESNQSVWPGIYIYMYICKSWKAMMDSGRDPRKGFTIVKQVMSSI